MCLSHLKTFFIFELKPLGWSNVYFTNTKIEFFFLHICLVAIGETDEKQICTKYLLLIRY